MTDIVKKLREPLVIGFAVPIQVHAVLQEAANQRGAAADTIEYLRGFIAELEQRVSEDDARWSGMTIRAASADTHPKDGDVQQAPLVSGAVPKADAQTTRDGSGNATSGNPLPVKHG